MGNIDSQVVTISQNTASSLKKIDNSINCGMKADISSSIMYTEIDQLESITEIP